MESHGRFPLLLETIGDRRSRLLFEFSSLLVGILRRFLQGQERRKDCRCWKEIYVCMHVRCYSYIYIYIYYIYIYICIYIIICTGNMDDNARRTLYFRVVLRWIGPGTADTTSSATRAAAGRPRRRQQHYKEGRTRKTIALEADKPLPFG